MRRLLPFVLVALVVASCGNGDDGAAPDTPEPDPTTTTPAPEAEPAPLAEVGVALTPVADVADATALAVRDGDDTLYVAEQPGRVVAVRDGETEVVLDVSERVSVGGEQGLLGLAFSPDGDRLYVHFSDLDGDTRVDEHAVDDGTVAAEPTRTVFTAEQPFGNHNGGQLAVDDDGMLWIGLGDGGGAGDPEDHAQDPTTVLGTLLRIDPDGGDPYGIPDDNPFVGGDAAPEVWAYGLRNPWRFSFDAETGDLWIADVGQAEWEEINLAPAPERGAGANYGWPHREGTHDFRGGGPDDVVDPVFEFPNSSDGCSITGGYVYRGSAIPDLVGAYVFSDYCQSTIRALRVADGEVVDETVFDAETTAVASFGQGPDRELYVLSQSEGLLRLDPT